MAAWLRTQQLVSQQQVVTSYYFAAAAQGWIQSNLMNPHLHATKGTVVMDSKRWKAGSEELSRPVALYVV